MNTTTLSREIAKVAERMAPAPPPPDAATIATALGVGALDPWQVAAIASRADRLLLNIHRQGGKSLLMTLLGLQTVLARPGALVLMVSPSERQSALLYRRLLDGYRRLRACGATTVRPRIENRLSLELSNGSVAVALPGSEPTIRGYSAVDLLLADEASRIPEVLIAAVRPMLAISGGRLIAASTPAGKVGWWYSAWAEGGDDWERYEIQAATCARIAPAFLAAERRALPRLVYQAEYECAFVETADAVFTASDIAAALVPGLASVRLFEAEGQEEVSNADAA